MPAQKPTDRPDDPRASQQTSADRNPQPDTPPPAPDAAEAPRSAADQRHIEALEKRAEEAEQKAQEAQAKADDLASKADAAANAAEDAGGATDDHCPDCGTRLQHYDGLNPHKVGQGFCPKCQTRKPLGH